MALNIVPTAGQSLNNSRNLVASNFITINDAFKLNHEELGVGTGKHTILTMPEQTAPAIVVANEGYLYCKESPTSHKTELFFKRGDDAVEIDLTGPGSSSTGSGWCQLVNGLYMEWGTSSTASGVKTITFTKITNCYSVQVSTYVSGDKNLFVHLDSIGSTTFTVQAQKLYSTGTVDCSFTYFAIGA